MLLFSLFFGIILLSVLPFVLPPTLGKYFWALALPVLIFGETAAYCFMGWLQEQANIESDEVGKPPSVGR